MGEYISKQKVLDYLNGYLHTLGNDDTLFDRGQRRALINSIQDISAAKAADVQPVNGWISVKDRLPPRNGNYLVVTEGLGFYRGCAVIKLMYFYNGCFKLDDKDVYSVNITHWMPLPQLPKE